MMLSSVDTDSTSLSRLFEREFHLVEALHRVTGDEQELATAIQEFKSATGRYPEDLLDRWRSTLLNLQAAVIALTIRSDDEPPQPLITLACSSFEGFEAALEEIARKGENAAVDDDQDPTKAELLCRP